MRSVRRSIRVAALLSALGLATGGCSSCELLTGPEQQIRQGVRTLGLEPYRAEGAEFELDFVVSAVRVRGDRAEVFARVDAEGSYRGSAVSCICIERVPFRRGAGGWAVDGFVLPRLAGVVDALEARRAAFEAQDHLAYERLLAEDYGGDAASRQDAVLRITRIFSGEGRVRQTIERRVLRVEARKAQVTEDFLFELEAPEADQEIPEKRGRAAYELRPSPDGWRFVGGLL